MITKWYYHKLENNHSYIKTTYRGNHMFYNTTVRDNIKADYLNGSSSWVLILNSYTKKSQILWLKMKYISYLTVPCVKYPHICHLSSPFQGKVKSSIILGSMIVETCYSLLSLCGCSEIWCLTELALRSKCLCWVVCMSKIRLLYSENFLMSLNKSSNLHAQSQQCKPFLKLVSFLKRYLS